MKYIISTYVNGAEINEPFLKAMEYYCKVNKAKLLLIPTDPKLTDKQEKNVYLVKKDMNLNARLKISLMPISAEQIDPITGLERLSNINKSIIYSSPKQRLKSVPNPSEDLPRVLMTPGAVTRPLPRTSKRSIIANIDHVYGAIIAEIESGTMYHFRQVQADKDGAFIDLGKQYTTNSITDVAVEALIPGDYHAGFTDPKVKDVILKFLEMFKPKHLILHDFFDGISVNHHIEHKILTKAKLGALNNLTSELLFASNELKQLANKSTHVVLVKSNHDEFLDRWLNESKYAFDPVNHIIGLELALAKANGSDPLEYGLKKYQKFNNVTFLKMDESFKVAKTGIECGAHGHRGANGSRGSATNLERCYQNIVYGHSHSPQILRSAWVVGTSTYLRLDYNEGPSSWMQTMCLVYPNGSRQLINVVKGKYTI